MLWAGSVGADELANRLEQRVGPVRGLSNQTWQLMIEPSRDWLGRSELRAWPSDVSWQVGKFSPALARAVRLLR